MATYPRPPDKPTLYHYKLQSMLGQGGTGVVYLAVDPKTGEVRALKQFRANFFRHKLHMRDLKSTANKFKKVQHPNVVKIYDFISGNEGEVLIMEYIDGPSLTWYIENRPFNLQEMIGIVVQICNGLAYIHEKGFVHHDLKPANILFTRKGLAKIADYSLSGSNPILNLLDQGMAEQITPLYVAPEIIRKEKTTKSVDLYSLGIIMYLMFARETPFKADNLQRLYASHLHDTPFHPSDVNPKVPRELGDVIMRLLAKKPEKRFQDADELRIMIAGMGQSRI
jgi:eukaryotic-like serine/threonine-protein kinase